MRHFKKIIALGMLTTAIACWGDDSPSKISGEIVNNTIYSLNMSEPSWMEPFWDVRPDNFLQRQGGQNKTTFLFNWYHNAMQGKNLHDGQALTLTYAGTDLYNKPISCTFHFTTWQKDGGNCWVGPVESTGGIICNIVVKNNAGDTCQLGLTIDMKPGK